MVWGKVSISSSCPVCWNAWTSFGETREVVLGFHCYAKEGWDVSVDAERAGREQNWRSVALISPLTPSKTKANFFYVSDLPDKDNGLLSMKAAHKIRRKKYTSRPWSIRLQFRFFYAVISFAQQRPFRYGVRGSVCDVSVPSPRQKCAL